jgi:cob(I)alamin adenosyltransferase
MPNHKATPGYDARIPSQQRIERTMKIYTKFGDQGQTVLFDGARVRKDHLRIETYGTVDELNSVLGLAIAECADAPLREALVGLQHRLFDLGADLATPRGSKNEQKLRRMGAQDVAELERAIDAATAELPALKRFVLPGGTVTAARLHVARTVCRRAERHLVALMGQEDVGGEALIYLNRLSDLLFTLARLANQREGRGDVEWESGK